MGGGGGFVIEKAPHPMALAGIDILLYEIMFMHEFSILNIITLQSPSTGERRW